MIQAENLTKRYGSTTAVDDVSFTVHSGRVTGFLGPNGAGKSTTMRMIVGLDRPSAGRVTVDGAAYAGLGAPLRDVGALLDARSVHPGRTARAHLRALGATHGIGRSRVNEVLELAGLAEVADRRVGGFSLGMGQRLGIATALLGDPHTIMLDEPVNGLDPEGVLWVRTLVRQLAAEGRTVFLSSHLMSEMALTADHVIVLGRGRVLADAAMQDLIDRASRGTVRVCSPESGALAEGLRRLGAGVDALGSGQLAVVGCSAEQIGEVAARAGIVLHQLTSLQSSLEEAYLQLTAGDVQYRSRGLNAAATATATDSESGSGSHEQAPVRPPVPSSPDSGATAPMTQGALR
jgi:ABC-2 type transport system ATP-binding protein